MKSCPIQCFLSATFISSLILNKKKNNNIQCISLCFTITVGISFLSVSSNANTGMYMVTIATILKAVLKQLSPTVWCLLWYHLSPHHSSSNTYTLPQGKPYLSDFIVYFEFISFILIDKKTKIKFQHTGTKILPKF